MVAITKVCLGFVCLPSSQKTLLPTTNSNNGLSKLEPIYLSSPLSKIPEMLGFKKKPDAIELFEDEVLDQIESEVVPDADYDQRLSEMDFETNRDKFVAGLLGKWIEAGIRLTVGKLRSLHKFVDLLELPGRSFTAAIEKHCNSTMPMPILNNMLVLADVFDPETRLFGHTNALFTIFSEKGMEVPEAIARAKGKRRQRAADVLRKIAEELIAEDIQQYAITHPIPKLESQLSPDFLDNQKKKLFEVFGMDSQELRNIRDPDIVRTAKDISRVLWEIEFYQKAAKPMIPDWVPRTLGVDMEFCNEVYHNVLDQKIQYNKGMTLPQLLTKEKKAFRLVKFRLAVEREVGTAKDRLREWYEQQQERLKLLSAKQEVDFAKYEVTLTPFEMVGGDLPYVDDREQEMLDRMAGVTNRLRPREMYDFSKDEFYHNREKFEEAIKPIKEKLRFHSHLTPEEKVELYFGKFDLEYSQSVRNRIRRTLLENLGNPFGTELQPYLDAEALQLLREIEEEEHMGEPVPDPIDERIRDDRPLSDEELAELKSNMNTQFLKHLMNLRHLEWSFDAARVCPVETLVQLHRRGQDIENPRPKTLKFVTPRAESAFKALDAYKKRKNTEADKIRNRLFHSNAHLSTVPDPEDEQGKMPMFRDDPDYVMADKPFVDEMVKAGAQITFEGEIPALRPHGYKSEYYEESALTKMRKTRPNRVYRCKCGYEFVAHMLTVGDNMPFYPSENTAFTKKGFKCRACGAPADAFEPSWTTGELGYWDDGPPRPPAYMMD